MGAHVDTRGLKEEVEPEGRNHSIFVSTFVQYSKPLSSEWHIVDMATSGVHWRLAVYMGKKEVKTKRKTAFTYRIGRPEGANAQVERSRSAQVRSEKPMCFN